MQEAKKQEWWDTLIFPALDCSDEVLFDVLAQSDGYVLRGGASRVEKEVRQQQDKPCLTLRSPSSTEEVSALHVDDSEIGRIAREEVMSLGLPHVAFLGYQGVVWSELRRRAFSEEGTLELLLPAGGDDSKRELDCLYQWVESLPKPVSVFAASDDLAVKLIQTAVLCGLEVPQDLAVIGADNNAHLCDNAVVTLSSIEFHAETIGRRCAWFLAEKMGLVTSLDKQPTLRPPELVIRQSSHPVTKHFVIYKAAMSWINRHALIGPSVDELADATAVSRRSLERIFDKIAQVSPASVIREKRIKAIIYLLAVDDVPLSYLAQQSGFPDQAAFSNFVHRNTGKSPSAIRSAGLGS